MSYLWRRLRITLPAVLTTLLFALPSIALPSMAADILVENARLVTGTRQGILTGASLLVRDGRIVSIAAQGRPKGMAAGAEVINADGAYVTAGFFDSSTTVGLLEVGGGIDNRDYELRGTDMGAGFQVSLGVNRFSSLIPMMRVQGVTRALVRPNAKSSNIAGQSAIIGLAGKSRMIMRDNNAVFVDLTEKASRFSGGSRAKAITDLLDALDEAALYSKNTAAYRSGDLRELRQSERDLKALLPIIQGVKPLAVHIDRAADIETILHQLGPYHLKLIVIGGREAWKVTPILVAQKVPVIINPMDNLPSSFDQIGARLDNAALLVEAGVMVAFMTEDVFTESRSLTQAAGVAVAYGLAWQDAVNAMTINPAMIWGIDKSYGALAPGRVADVLVWDGDPLEVTSRPTKIMIDGEWMSLETRQTLLRDRYADLDKGNTTFGYR
jgi:imidazolonepropionase-like amidohydrolase